MGWYWFTGIISRYPPPDSSEVQFGTRIRFCTWNTTVNTYRTPSAMTAIDLPLPSPFHRLYASRSSTYTQKVSVLWRCIHNRVSATPLARLTCSPISPCWVWLPDYLLCHCCQCLLTFTFDVLFCSRMETQLEARSNADEHERLAHQCLLYIAQNGPIASTCTQ